MKNTFYKFDVLLYREQGHIIIFSVFLLVVSENRKTQFFLTHPVYFGKERLKLKLEYGDRAIINKVNNAFSYQHF